MLRLIYGVEFDLRKNTCDKKKNVYYVDESFFKNWTPKMAYVLGFFAADGCLATNRKRGNKYIEFVSTDYEIIEKIKRTLKSRHKIGVRIGKVNCKKAYRLQIGSEEICSDLIDLGFMPNKSKVLNFPQIPTVLIPHFVRGYFDGDGHSNFCYYKRKNRSTQGKALMSGFTSGSQKFLQALQLILQKDARLTLGTLYYHTGYRLIYSSKDSNKLFNFMYGDCTQLLFIVRKYLKFKKNIEDFGRVV